MWIGALSIELHREIEAKPGCPLIVSYGLSEATCTSTINPLSRAKIGSVGTVLPSKLFASSTRRPTGRLRLVRRAKSASAAPA